MLFIDYSLSEDDKADHPAEENEIMLAGFDFIRVCSTPLEVFILKASSFFIV